MEEEKKIYTIDDIARELGVSKTTVSRAISGKGRIGQATRERVLAFIQEHDYRPNVMAKGLAKRKTYNLALLLPKDYIATEFPFFKDCMNGICEVASRCDYDILISMVDDHDLSQVRRLEYNKKVDGIILSRTRENSKVQKYLKSCNVPFVVIGPCKDGEIPSVDNQNQEASIEITGVLLMKGMKKLALLGGNEAYSVTKSRYQGFIQAHKKFGVPFMDELVFMNADNQLKVTEAVTKALSYGAEGFICMDDVICNMCLGSLREKKITIPTEIRVASLYDSINLEFNNPPVTSVRFDTVRLGKMACVKLLKLLGEKPEEDLVPLNYQVILRESTQ
ncbi:LacI family DNA-binding transcriptional regulator [Blautia sp. HCP3S3_H10_1]|uniref:LacI family DNA-binding transcriptional regulator n=1 Tax=unclassified Blautia TaxID=2648079 RepID=UPI003F92A2C0|nr:LacI family DNA-binding transcriptional regulator [Clostridia bacterium]